MSFVLAAFLLGLFGSAHCVMMCGGVACTLSAGLVRLGKAPRVVRSTLAYNVGRIAGYVALGAFVGAIGHAVDSIAYVGSARLVLRLFAGLVLVSAGLYIAGVWKRFSNIERLGAPIWQRVKRFVAVGFESNRLASKLAVGALWGLMPCGLVYAGFSIALATGRAADGALTMLAFGLGTAPAMIATGIAGARVARVFGARAWMRRAAGIVVVVFGLVDVASAAASMGAEGAHDRNRCACSHSR